jgi:hypothetical protein
MHAKAGPVKGLHVRAQGKGKKVHHVTRG